MIVALLVLPYLLLKFYGQDGKFGVALDVLYVGIWTFFVVEACVMLRLAPSNKTWLQRNVLDVAIIALTAPFHFLPDGFEALQALWVLRILDLLPLVHQHLFRITVLRYGVMLWVLTIFTGAIMFGWWERDYADGGPKNLFDAMYFVSTVQSSTGFGDYLPHFWYTKLLTMFLQFMVPVLGGIFTAGFLPLFDKEFAEGFSNRMSQHVERIAGDVANIEQDIDEIERGERAQDRVLAQIARDLQQIRTRLDGDEAAGSDGTPR